MNFEFSILRQKFLESLKQDATLSSGSAALDYSNINIFEYSDLFEAYLKENVGDSFENLNVDFSSLSEIDVENNQIQAKNGQENSNFTLDFLNELLKDEDVVAELDLNNDNTLDEEEILGFLEYINANDNDLEKLSLTDIMQGIEQIKDDSYSKTKAETSIDEQKEETMESQDVTSSEQNTQTTGPLSSSSDYSPNTNSNSNTSLDNSNNSVETKNYANMTIEELTAEKTNQQTKVNEAAENINKVHSGENEAVKTAKETAEQKKLEYDEAVKNDEKISEDLKGRRTQNLEDISNQESLIDGYKMDLNNKESEIFAANNEIAALTSNISALKSSLSSLSSQTSEDADVQAQIEAQKVSVQSQITEAEGKLKEAEGKLETLNGEKATINGQIAKAEGVLKTLETQKTEIEQEITANCSEETKQAMAAYNQAKADVETVKQTELTKAQTELNSQQSELQKIEAEINVKNSEKIQKDNSVKTKGENFGSDIELDFNVQVDSNGNKYLVIGPKNVDPNQELPVMVYLHGSGEFNCDEETLKSNVGPGNFLRDCDLQNFNGYIICPYGTGQSPSWANEEKETQIRSTLESFSQTHNVDTDRISLVGHSAGGTGVEYLADEMSDIFSRAVILSGFDSTGNLANSSVETKAYVGEYDYEESKNFTTKTLASAIGNDNVQVVKGATHSDLPKKVFYMDLDGDGKADILEFCFFEED